MIRFLATSIGSVLLAVAMVFAVGDIARSLAQEETRLVSLGDALASVGLPLEPGAGPAAEFAGVFAAWPAAIVLAIPAFLLLLAGRPRRPRRSRYRP